MIDIAGRVEELKSLIEGERSPRYIITLAYKLHELIESGKGDFEERQEAQYFLDFDFTIWLGDEPFEKVARAILSLEDVPSGQHDDLLRAGGSQPEPYATSHAKSRRSAVPTQAGRGRGGNAGTGAAANSPQAGQIGLGFGE